MKPGLLTSNLLIRKGTATPISVVPGSAPNPGAESSAHSNCNRPGSAVPQRCAAVMEREPPRRTRERPSPADTLASLQQRARISIRLDRARHVRIKLMALQENLSMQAIIIDAIDRYLADSAPAEVHEFCHNMFNTNDAVETESDKTELRSFRPEDGK